jgi:CRP-like cAMP-binding protein
MSNILENMKAFCLRVAPEITEPDWQELEQIITFKSLQKGAFLLKAGEICRNVYYLNKGLIRFFYLVDGKEITTGFIDDNQFATDYTSFLLQVPSFKNIEVMEDTALAGISFNNIQELYKKNPVFQIFGRRMAEFSFLTFDQDNTKLKTQSPEVRYKTLVEKQSPLLQQIPQYMLASYLGITPEHLSRIRKKISSYK